MEFTVHNLAELDQVAAAWIEQHKEPTVCLLEGAMGAGKTTFVKSICNALHISDNVSSPTFSLVNEYRNEAGKSVFHFDLYRLKHSDELIEIGFEEYLDSGNYVFIEWPELGTPFYENDYKRIKIETENEIRRISFD